MRVGILEQRDHLLAPYAGKSLEKLLDRIARFQMIEKTLHRDASSGKNGLTAKNFRILRYDAARDDQNYRMSFIVAKPIFSCAQPLSITIIVRTS